MLIASIIIVWLVMWIATVGAREKYLTWGNYQQEERYIGHFCWGLIWPAYLTGWLVFTAGKKLAQGELKLPQRTKQSEIAAGIPCPIHVLVQMVKASLIKDATVNHRVMFNSKVRVEFDYNVRVDTLRIGETVLWGTQLTDTMHKDLKDFYGQMLAHQNDVAEAKRLADARSLALDGIESLLTPEPVTLRLDN